MSGNQPNNNPPPYYANPQWGPSPNTSSSQSPSTSGGSNSSAPIPYYLQQPQQPYQQQPQQPYYQQQPQQPYYQQQPQQPYYQQQPQQPYYQQQPQQQAYYQQQPQQQAYYEPKNEAPPPYQQPMPSTQSQTSPPPSYSQPHPQQQQFQPHLDTPEVPHNDNVPYATQFGPSPDLAPTLNEWFSTVDMDRSGYIDCGELCGALNAAGEKFEKSLAAEMIAMFDTDNDKKIDRKEFVALFGYIMKSREVFESYGKNGLQLEHLPKALHEMRFGFPSDNKQLEDLWIQLLIKFDSNSSFSLNSFEQFLRMCLWLGQVKGKYQRTRPSTPFESYIRQQLK